MDENLKQKVMAFLANNHTLRLATVDTTGQPMAHTVEYVTDGPYLYFSTSNKSRKAINLNSNPKAAGAIDSFLDDWNKIQGLQLEFSATLITDPTELQKVMGIFMAKFPQMKDMPPSPDSALFKLTITHGFMLDYAQGFGHRDEILM